jgi:hypothetical protein
MNCSSRHNASFNGRASIAVSQISAVKEHKKHLKQRTFTTNTQNVPKFKISEFIIKPYFVHNYDCNDTGYIYW